MNKYHATIEWGENNTPRSKIYDDFYYSSDSGTEESKYVFINHNNLKQRFTDLKNDDTFIIAETGFGVGINFFSTLLLWESTHNGNSSLHYISIEKHPISKNDISSILNNFTEFKSYIDEFIEQYYLMLPGFHRITLSKNVYLTLIIGDVIDVLPQLDIKVNAWFLDGFSPKKNPDMWSQNILKNVARLSSDKTTFATYSASSNVKKTLIDNGFCVYKDSGFGKKREMLYGTYCTTELADKKDNKVYYHRNTEIKTPKNKRIAIIGAGLSGATTAYSLAKRGYKNITVFEKSAKIAQGASGNYQGMLYGTWSAFGGSSMELSCSGYRLSNYLIKKILQENTEYQECGIIQLSHNAKQDIRNQQLINANLPNEFLQPITHEEIYKIANINVAESSKGIFFPKGMWLKPISLVEKLLEEYPINIKTNHDVVDIKPQENGAWIIMTATSNFDFDVVILCNSYMVEEFSPTQFIKLRKIRGQTTYVNQETSLNSVICGEGYITPSVNNKYTIGATFDFMDTTTDLKREDHYKNINNFSQLLPNIISNINISSVDGKASIRSSYNDYLPIIGPIANEVWFNNEYKKLSKDKNINLKTRCNYLPNLYVNVGHGSKGILTTPISAEIIADYIESTPIAISENLRQAIHPNRILLRNIIKDTNNTKGNELLK